MIGGAKDEYGTQRTVRWFRYEALSYEGRHMARTACRGTKPHAHEVGMAANVHAAVLILR
jgi:hypothetical protein